MRIVVFRLLFYAMFTIGSLYGGMSFINSFIYNANFGLIDSFHMNVPRNLAYRVTSSTGFPLVHMYEHDISTLRRGSLLVTRTDALR